MAVFRLVNVEDCQDELTDELAETISLPQIVRAAIIDLVEHLALVRAAFLQPCIDHLVKAFAPPPIIVQQLSPPPPREAWIPSNLVRDVHSCVCHACAHILAKVSCEIRITASYLTCKTYI